jgi:hypothetical protein
VPDEQLNLPAAAELAAAISAAAERLGLVLDQGDWVRPAHGCCFTCAVGARLAAAVGVAAAHEAAKAARGLSVAWACRDIFAGLTGLPAWVLIGLNDGFERGWTDQAQRPGSLSAVPYDRRAEYAIGLEAGRIVGANHDIDPW